MEQYQALLEFFKVMGNADRVKIAAKLMDHPYTSTEVADLLGIRPLEALDHLAKLAELELVTVENRDQRSIYAFNPKALYNLNRDILKRDQLPTPIDHLPEPDRKALQPFFVGNRLLAFPESKKKFAILINWLVTRFEEGVYYSEQQVNEIITAYHHDYATLRRAMIDQGLMRREKGTYWRTHGTGQLSNPSEFL